MLLEISAFSWDSVQEVWSAAVETTGGRVVGVVWDVTKAADRPKEMTNRFMVYVARDKSDVDYVIAEGYATTNAAAMERCSVEVTLWAHNGMQRSKSNPGRIVRGALSKVRGS